MWTNGPVKLKGLALKNTLLRARKVHQRVELERVKAAMPARLREHAGDGPAARVVPGRALLNAPPRPSATRWAGGRRGKRAERSPRRGRRSSSRAPTPFARAHGAVRLRLGSGSERFWGQYYDSGEARWVDRGPEVATPGVFGGVAGFNEEEMWRSAAGLHRRLPRSGGVARRGHDAHGDRLDARETRSRSGSR